MKEPSGAQRSGIPTPSQPNTSVWTERYLRTDQNRLLQTIRRIPQIKIITKFIRDQEARILDVGCGNGLLLRMLREHGYQHLYGLEPNQTLVQWVMCHDPQLRRKIAAGRAGALPFAAAQFDCLLFFNVLHHLQNKEEYFRTLQEADRCLKNKGLIIMVEPCRKFIYTAKRNLAHLLSPCFPLFKRMYASMMEEKDLMEYFMDNFSYFPETLLQLGYRIRHNRKFFHQIVLIVQKSE